VHGGRFYKIITDDENDGWLFASLFVYDGENLAHMYKSVYLTRRDNLDNLEMWHTRHLSKHVACYISRKVLI